MSHQDWETVTWTKTGSSGGGADKHQKDVNSARQRGEAVATEKKFLGGQNKSTKGAIPSNAKKLDEDTGDYHVDRVDLNFSNSLRRARTDKKMTQAQLAQAINEKVSVVNDYENGKAVPNGQIIQKLNRVLGVALPRVTKK